MENTTKISCSVVTHIGTGRAVNEDRIYANGKFLSTYESENSSISLEASGNQFIFALSDSMDAGRDAGSRISINDELKKFHQKAAASTKDIQVKLDEMADYVQQSSNLLYSLSLGEEIGREWNASFAGIIVENGSLAAANLGSCKIFKVDGENLKLLMNDNRKAERLLKMGIISNEQAEMLSGQFKSSDDKNLKVKKSEIFKLKEGNTFLLCSNGLTEAVSEDSILEILSENRDTDTAAGMLVNEAIENGGVDNITAMVIKIDSVSGAGGEEAAVGAFPSRRSKTANSRYYKATKKNSFDASRIISNCIVFAVVAAVIFGAFTLWRIFRDPGKVKDTVAQSTAQTTTNNKTSGSTVPQNSTDEDTAQSSTYTEATGDNTDDAAAGGVGIVIDENTTYTVKAGDSLTKISRIYYGTDNKYQLIMDANNIKDPGKIQVGQVLKIPPLK